MNEPIFEEEQAPTLEDNKKEEFIKEEEQKAPVSSSIEQKPLEYLQFFMTFGYLSFLTIGISKEVLKYTVLDINILPYFNLTDIMLSPLDVLRNDLVIVVAPFVLLVIVDGLRGFAKSRQDKNPNFGGKKKQWVAWWANLEINWFLVGLAYTGFVLGVANQGAVHDAYDLQEAMETGTLGMTHQLTFQDKEQLEVAIIGQSSEFIFYVIKDQHQISISPVDGIIKSWVPLEPRDTIPPSTN